MNESDFARRVTGNLSVAVRHVDEVMAVRLRDARERALAVQRPAGLRAALMQWRPAWRSGFGGSPMLRTVMLALLVLVVFVAGDYWAALARVSALQEVDTALLMDDLPIDAYLDPDFRVWLARDSQS